MGCLHTRGYIARSPAGRGLPCLPREIDPLITIIALCHDAIVAVAQVAAAAAVNLTQPGVH